MLASRFTTAIVLLGSFASALWFLPNGWWAALLVPVLFVAAWEWCSLSRLGHFARGLFFAAITASVMILWLVVVGAGRDPGQATAAEVATYLVSGLFWLLIALPMLVRRWHVSSPFALGIVGWLLLVPTWLALTRLQADPARLLIVLGIVWLSDSAAFLAGKAWGRNRLAPHISPGKTWEGVAGAAVAVAVYYVALSGAAFGGAWMGWRGATLFTAVAVLGVVGDLFESWVKRQAGVKDSGTLLPGHGGVLDRIDSMTAALPMAALLLLSAR